MRSATADANCLSHWFPPLLEAGLPVPRTAIVKTEVDLVNWLDGKSADGEDEFLVKLRYAATEIGLPCFLRTGHTSGKHSWRKTCYVTDAKTIDLHVARLVEESFMGFPSLPTDVWAVRELIDTEPLFFAFQQMPITREFRLFSDGFEVLHQQPYWPPDAIVSPGAYPEGFGWRERLAEASKMTGDEYLEIERLAVAAAMAQGGGEWSVDLLQDRHGKWWITDMARAEDSFRWEP